MARNLSVFVIQCFFSNFEFRTFEGLPLDLPISCGDEIIDHTEKISNTMTQQNRQNYAEFFIMLNPLITINEIKKNSRLRLTMFNEWFHDIDTQIACLL